MSYRRGVRLAWLVVVGIGCGGSASSGNAPPPEPLVNRGSGCELAIDLRTGGVAIDGKPLASFAPAELRRVLGPPDRIEHVTKHERYEEWDEGGHGTSDMVKVTDAHHVYDHRGFVFRTRNDHFTTSDDRIELMLVFLPHARTFDNREAPDVVPTSRGTCAVTINGHALDPEIDLRPRGATYQTQSAQLFGTKWGFTSYASVIDGIYSDGQDDAAYVQIQLDAPETGRASYLEIRMLERPVSGR